jgi:hypothetical protein
MWDTYPSELTNLMEVQCSNEAGKGQWLRYIYKAGAASWTIHVALKYAMRIAIL